MSPYHIDKRWLATGKLLIANGTFVLNEDQYLTEPPDLNDEWLKKIWVERNGSNHHLAWLYFDYEQTRIYGKSYGQFRGRIDIKWHVDQYLAECAEIYCTKS